MEAATPVLADESQTIPDALPGTAGINNLGTWPGENPVHIFGESRFHRRHWIDLYVPGARKFRRRGATPVLHSGRVSVNLSREGEPFVAEPRVPVKQARKNAMILKMYDKALAASREQS